MAPRRRNGWSKTRKIDFWARLDDGHRAYRPIPGLVTPTRERRVSEGAGLYLHLFDAHPRLPIDANVGRTAGIVEMLPRNHTGEIELPPARRYRDVATVAPCAGDRRAIHP